MKDIFKVYKAYLRKNWKTIIAILILWILASIAGILEGIY